MALNQKNLPQKESNRVQQANIEPGVYPARVVQIIDLGLQSQRPYAGKEKAPANEVMFTYELVDEFMKDEDGEDVLNKPRWLSEQLPWYGLFADKAKSTQRYLALDPNEELGGDLSKLINSPCNVTVVNNKAGDKVYDNVANIAAMRPKDAANCPELQNPVAVFDLDEPDMAVFNRLPKWIQEKIVGNLNFKGSALEAAIGRGEGAKPEAKKEEAKPAPVKKPRQPVVEEDDSDDTPY